jgi:tricorn protease
VQRLVEIPVPAGNYSELIATEKRLFLIERETSLPRKAALMVLEISNDSPKLKTLVEDIKDYEVSLDKKKLAVRKGDDFYVLETSAAPPAKLDEAKVNLSGWTFALDPREDWRQVFTESWRLERDYFYDPKMHGVDWKGMLDKYLPLVDRVRSRGELADLQAQMASELSALHIYVSGGDFRDGPENIDLATLGARLVRDEAAGGYRIEHIYRSDPDLPDELSPLAQPGVELKEGEIIIAINGAPILAAPEAGALLRKQTGKQVRLSVKSGASGAMRDVVVYPISAGREADLRYDEWEYTRRLAVDSLGRGEIGYVHLRAMGSNNLTEWYREFYPAFDRQGLIVDVRHNGGGNIESWLLEKLSRKAWMYWQPRVGNLSWNMQYAFRGHLVVLVDEWTASDGEAFAEGFRRLGLGKVIGTRTWGGEIWLSASNRLVDRGIVTAAEIGVYGPEGKWLIEGHGVDPDIVVDNLPHATFKGEDAQLAAAVKHLQDLIKQDPRPVPPAPAYPDKASPDNRLSPTNGESKP